jgi:hypothetical protein
MVVMLVKFIFKMPFAVYGTAIEFIDGLFSFVVPVDKRI